MTTVAHWYHLRLSVLMAGGGGHNIFRAMYRLIRLPNKQFGKQCYGENPFRTQIYLKKNKEKSQTFRRDFVFRCQCYAARIFFCSYGMGFGVGILIQNSIFYRQIFKSVKWKVPLNLFCVDNHFLRISKSEIA